MTGRSTLSREEIAAIEVGHTDVSPAVARALSISFLLLIASIPAIQGIHEFRTVSREKTEARSSGRQYNGHRFPACLDGTMLWPTRAELAGVKDLASFLAVNTRMLRDIHAYEDALEDNSILHKALHAPAQYVLTGWLRGGNEKVYCGKGRWLFFRPGIDYLTGSGFLDPAAQEQRSRIGNEWTAPPQPDPISAITNFHAQLAERGIDLVIVPTPVKPMIHPEKFSGRFSRDSGSLQNPSFAEFKERLEAEGIPVFDIAPDLAERKQHSGKDLYLESDTHWTPETMQYAACVLELSSLMLINFQSPKVSSRAANCHMTSFLPARRSFPFISSRPRFSRVAKAPLSFIAILSIG
jgi:alginate O-acetyltransferase complex protein AlgJ